MPTRRSRDTLWAPLPLATSLSRLVRARGGRPDALNTPVAVAPAVAITRDMTSASSAPGVAYTRTTIIPTPLEGHLNVPCGGAAAMQVASIALLECARRFMPVILPSLAPIVPLQTVSRIEPMRFTVHLMTIPPATFM